jgi:hypothetical protein
VLSNLPGKSFLEIRHASTAIFALFIHFRRCARRRRSAGAKHSAHAAFPTAVTDRGAGLLDPESLTQATVPRPEKS